MSALGHRVCITNQVVLYGVYFKIQTLSSSQESVRQKLHSPCLKHIYGPLRTSALPPSCGFSTPTLSPHAVWSGDLKDYENILAEDPDLL